MTDTPTTNIEVKMEIPAARYIGRTQEIMSQYGDVVEDAMKEIQKDLMFDKEFQNSIKEAVKDKMTQVVKDAIKSAAEQIVWDVFYKNSNRKDIERIVSDSIMNVLQGNIKA